MKSFTQRILTLYIILALGIFAWSLYAAYASESDTESRYQKVARLEVSRVKLKGLKDIYEVERPALKFLKADLYWYKAKDYFTDCSQEIAKTDNAIAEIENIACQIEETEEEIENLENDIYKLANNGDNEDSPWKTLLQFGQQCVVSSLLKALRWLVYLYGMAFAYRFTNYFIISRIIGFFNAVSFGAESASESAFRNVSSSEKLIRITLSPGETLITRDEKYIGGYHDAATHALQKRMQWIFSLSHPIMSIACQLTLLTRFSNPAEASQAADIMITSDNADEYFTEIQLSESQEYYITPSDLIAFSDTVKIRACWNLHIPALCLGQIRYYVLSGRGRVVVRAQGGSTVEKVTISHSLIRKQHSLICASQGVMLHVRRNEIFLPYLLGNADLYDMKLVGNGECVIRNVLTEGKTPTEKTLHVLAEALGKLLGF